MEFSANILALELSFEKWFPEWHDHNDGISNSFAHLKICTLFSEELQVEIENRYEMPGILLPVTVIHTLSAEPVIIGCVWI